MSDVNYYKITLSYEVPYNVFDSDVEAVTKARDSFYEKLKNIVPDKYEKFSTKLTLFQIKDTLNFIITYDSYFRSVSGMPMSEYVDAKNLKDCIHKEFEDFFESIDCEFEQIKIKTLL